ncbi:MAG TPA: hypothetical protein VEQ11_06905 [Chloroflexota bacterium]|nr:hypothetical protein [Chloroflexota bacterium]
MARPRRPLAVWLLLAGLTLSACSPEATRARSGGPGADVGNRAASVQLQQQPNPYYRTPAVGQAVGK